MTRSGNYFQSPEAHNSVIVDGHDDALASTPTTSGDDRHLSYARGTRQLSDGLLHERAIVVIKPNTVVILDRLVGAAEDGEQATTLYHFAPGISLTPIEGGAGQYVAHSEGRALQVWLDASEPIDVQFSASGKSPGVRDARVTRGIRQEERSPLLSVRHRVEPGDWSIAVLQPGARKPARPARGWLTTPWSSLGAESGGWRFPWTPSCPPRFVGRRAQPRRERATCCSAAATTSLAASAADRGTVHPARPV